MKIILWKTTKIVINMDTNKRNFKLIFILFLNVMYLFIKTLNQYSSSSTVEIDLCDVNSGRKCVYLRNRRNAWFMLKYTVRCTAVSEKTFRFFTLIFNRTTWTKTEFNYIIRIYISSLILITIDLVYEK